MSRPHFAGVTRWVFISLILSLVAARSGIGSDTVVVYSALDREFAEPVLKAYGERTGVRVLPKFDVESTKTVGLTNLIIAEASAAALRPVLEQRDPQHAAAQGARACSRRSSRRHAGELPETFKAKDGTWYGFAARARILIVNTKLVAEADRPKGIKDLLDPKWKGKIGIAKPLFGTTATHAACLFAAWGDEKAKRFLPRPEGQRRAGPLRQQAGRHGRRLGPDRLRPDRHRRRDGRDRRRQSRWRSSTPTASPASSARCSSPTRWPSSRGCPHRKEAEALADHLLSPEVEAALADGPSAQIPLLKSTNVKARVETPKTVHAMEVDFEAAAKLWDKVAAFLAAEFAGMID